VVQPGQPARPALDLNHERAFEHLDERRGEVLLLPALATGRQLDNLARESSWNRYRDAGNRPGRAHEAPALDARRLRRLRVLRVRAPHEHEQPHDDCDRVLESHRSPPPMPHALPERFTSTPVPYCPL